MYSKIDRVIERNISRTIDEFLADISFSFRISTLNWSIGESYDAHLHNTDEKALYTEEGTHILDFTLDDDGTLLSVGHINRSFF